MRYLTRDFWLFVIAQAALEGAARTCHQWTMRDGSLGFEVISTSAGQQATGTTICLTLKQTDAISRLFAGVRNP